MLAPWGHQDRRGEVSPALALPPPALSKSEWHLGLGRDPQQGLDGLAALRGFSASPQPRVSPVTTHETKTQGGEGAGGFKRHGGTSRQKVLAKNCEALGTAAPSHQGHMHIDLDPSL